MHPPAARTNDSSALHQRFLTSALWNRKYGGFPSSDAFDVLLHLCTSVVLSTLFIKNKKGLKQDPIHQ